MLLVTYLAQTGGGSGCWLDIKKLVEVGILIFVLALFTVCLEIINRLFFDCGNILLKWKMFYSIVLYIGLD